jgi:hypothetical protein
MAVDKTINLKINTAEAVTALKKVRSEVDVTYAELRKTTPVELDATKAKAVLKNLDTDINSSAKGAKEIGKGAEGSVKGFKKLTISTQAFGLALKATGIGLIVGAFVKLQEALGKNQVVMDSFNVVTETISITFQELVNKVVTATQTAVKFFSKVGNVIKKFVKKDLDGLTSSYEANNEVVETTIQKNRRLATEIVNLRKEVQLAEAEQRLLQLTYQKEAEIQRQIRDDVNLTIDERIAANEKLGKILDEQFEEERGVAEKKLELAEKELSKNKDNVDLQVAVTNAKTELADLDERITGQRSEQLINLTALQNEQTQAIKDSQQALEDYLAKQAEESEKIGQEYEAVTNRNQTAREKEEEATREHFEKLRTASTEAFMDGQIDSQQAVDDAIALKKEETAALLEIEKKYSQASTKIDKLTADQKRGILATSMGQVSNLLGQESKAGKALAIGQALINTYVGATTALKQGGIFGAIAAAGVVASGMASVKQIKDTKLPGADGVSIPTPEPKISSIDTEIQEEGPTGIGALVPNIQALGSPTLGGAAPVQAYVVENDISNSQALQEELEVQATL